MHTIYIAQTPEYGKKKFKERFAKEITRVKEQCLNAHYTGVADGAADNWSFLNPRVSTTTLDFWHASEYLTFASKVVSKSKYEQKQWLIAARHWLKYAPNGALDLLEDMKTFRSKRKVSKEKKEKLENAITYFSNHHHQMAYPDCIEKGLPIGSGVTEAACKVIVKERLCCSGMKWKEFGAQNVLNIRCLTHTKQRWSQFWDFFSLHGRLN